MKYISYFIIITLLFISNTFTVDSKDLLSNKPEKLYNKSIIYYRNGNYFEALNGFKKISETLENSNRYYFLASVYNYIALINRHIGNHPESLIFYKKALVIQKKTLGENHAYTGITYNNISMTYTSMGKYQKSLEYLQKSLKISEAISGKKHPDTAKRYNNIAETYRQMGDFNAAMKYQMFHIKKPEVVVHLSK